MENDDLEQFINNHIRLIEYSINLISRGIYMSYSMKREDLRQEAIIELIKAKRDFNKDLGTKFSSYAVTRIYRRLIRVIAKSKTVNYGPYFYEKYREYIMKKTRHFKIVTHELSYTEISVALNIPIADVYTYENYLNSTISIDNEETGLWPTKKCTQNFIEKTDVEVVAINSEYHEFLLKLINSLDERYAFILRERYGFNNENTPKTLNEIGIMLGMSRQAVNQHEKYALTLLRNINNYKTIK